MAATKIVPTKSQQERTRAAIQTTQLVKRLQNFALGLPEANATDEDAPPVELDGAKIKAIEILLRKSLPDLSSVDIGNKDGKALKIEDTGSASAKVLAVLDAIAERSGKTG